MRTEVAKLFYELIFATEMLAKRIEYVLLHIILVYLSLLYKRRGP
jgi:hypothetical protein